MGIKVGFVPLYRIEFPSSRYRVFQFMQPLRRRGFNCLYVEAPQKNLPMRLRYLPRLLRLALASDVLYVQKRTFPLWVLRLVRRVNPRIVYDLDDAIYMNPGQQAIVNEIIRSAADVVAGNETLAHYARRLSERVTVIPTVVDTDLYCPPDTWRYKNTRRHLDAVRRAGDDRVIIGWIGMDPNHGDLALIREALNLLGERYGPHVVLRIVSSQPLDLATRLETEFVPWELASSRRELQGFDIGIMPLLDDPWNWGKCGFKLIQYMAVSAPAVASPVGVNREIVIDGQTGYLAATTEDWYERLCCLIDDPISRVEMGQAGRERVEQRYSVDAVLPTLIQVLERAAGHS
jgi:glycosyltransferase involved in cell wall biosynthesis